MFIKMDKYRNQSMDSIIKNDEIIDDPSVFFNNIDHIFRYINYRGIDRCPNLLKFVISDPRKIYDYSMNILKHRWYKYEHLLLSDIYLSYLYAFRLMNERWNDLEELILEKKDARIAFLYAKDVIKGKWIEAEKFITDDDVYGMLYHIFLKLI
jgi:hypothetical protein